MTPRDVALAAHDAGLAAWPPAEDGTKMPLTEPVPRSELIRLFGEAEADRLLDGRPSARTWKHRQRERASRAALEALYANGRTGAGLVCGAVSGNLELFEFDDRAVYDQYKALALEVGYGDLVERIEAGYLEETPGGGIHWLMRSDEIAGNTKLARRPKRPEEMEHPNDKVKVTIETRGDGGYAIIAPSNGRIHPTGRPYILLPGGPATIATITPEERRQLWALARTFDEMPEAAPRELAVASGERAAGGRPGDDFNARATWGAILGPAGWQVAARHGDKELWRRPGKDRG
jgi:hypothetical protein